MIIDVPACLCHLLVIYGVSLTKVLRRLDLEIAFFLVKVEGGKHAIQSLKVYLFSFPGLLFMRTLLAPRSLRIGYQQNATL